MISIIEKVVSLGIRNKNVLIRELYLICLSKSHFFRSDCEIVKISKNYKVTFAQLEHVSVFTLHVLRQK